MPPTATRTRTTVDLTELGFETPSTPTVEVEIEERDDTTIVEAAHDTAAWRLTFDRYGEVSDTPACSAPRWLGPVIKKAAPQLRVA